MSKFASVSLAMAVTPCHVGLGGIVDVLKIGKKVDMIPLLNQVGLIAALAIGQIVVISYQSSRFTIVKALFWCHMRFGGIIR